MISGIYQILNKIDGKFYIGSAIHFRRRFGNHKRRLRKGDHDNPKLQAAWNKYGEENFQFVILEICEKDSLIVKEQSWLDWMKPEYNILKIAGSSIGHKHSQEFKRNRSELYTGRKLSEEVKAKIANALKGKKKSDQARKNIAKAKLGNKYGVGKRSLEFKNKMSLKRKETIDRKRIALYGNQIIILEKING